MSPITPALPLLFALVGLAVGSFLNVLSYRVPEGESIRGRSHCPGCRHELSAWELVPVFSYMLLRGRCRSCHMVISGQYPLVEILAALFAALALRTHTDALAPAILLALTLESLLLIAVTDARTQRIPDMFSGTFILFASVYAFTLPAWTPWAPAIGAGLFAMQWILSRGRWVGSADILIGLGMGILLGDIPRTIIALSASYIIGAAWALMLLATHKKSRKDAMGFAPFLAIGTGVALFMGDRLVMLIMGAY